MSIFSWNFKFKCCPLSAQRIAQALLQLEDVNRRIDGVKAIVPTGQGTVPGNKRIVPPLSPDQHRLLRMKSYSFPYLCDSSSAFWPQDDGGGGVGVGLDQEEESSCDSVIDNEFDFDANFMCFLQAQETSIGGQEML